MNTSGPKDLVRAIVTNPWSSVQDGLLLASVMLVAALLALEYNLFWFVSALSEPERKISLAEAIFLTVLLALCIFSFVIRRLREERRNVVRHVVTKNQVRELRALALQDSLTGLANRRALLKALMAATASPLPAGASLLRPAVCPLPAAGALLPRGAAVCPRARSAALEAPRPRRGTGRQAL